MFNENNTQDMRDHVFFLKDKVRIIRNFADQLMNELDEMDEKLLDIDEQEFLERWYQNKAVN